MLIELPNGNWIDPANVTEILMLDDRARGPRVTLSTTLGYASHAPG